jgi:probable F420-dependent oxidoreductase
MTHPGMTVPFPGSLADQREAFAELADLGYTDAWSVETDAYDGFTPLALAAVWAPTLRLGTAIVPAFTRGPAVLALSAAAIADLAPGRFLLGIGSSSNVIVERWNGIPFERPYQRVRDVVRFLRDAFAGEKIAGDFDTFEAKGFKLGRVPEIAPKLMVAALRPGMLRLAGAEGDGAILNWLSAADVAQVAPYVHEGGPGKELVCRIFVCPNDDAEVARAGARRSIAAYLNVPVYQEFHRWLGRGDAMAECWERWAAGDRAGALEAIPDSVVDELIVHGTPAECRAHIQRYLDNGITTTSLSVLPFGGLDVRQAIRDLSPKAG